MTIVSRRKRVRIAALRAAGGHKESPTPTHARCGGVTEWVIEPWEVADPLDALAFCGRCNRQVRPDGGSNDAP